MERTQIRRTCKNQTCTREFTPQNRKDQIYCSKLCALRQSKRDWKARNSKRVRLKENERKRRRYENDPGYREKSKDRSSAYWLSLDEDTKFSKKKEQRERGDPEARRIYFREYHQKRSESDPEFRLAAALRSRVRAAIKNNAGEKAHKTMSLIGCSLKELRVYLEAKFEPWMTWKNYGKWHVDHIRPLKSFDLTDPAQQQQACHYTNLQPLSARDNLRKSSRL